MRSVAFILVTPLLACSATASVIEPPPPDGTGGGDDGGTVIAPPAFQLSSPAIDIKAGVEATYCYYFDTPNTNDLMLQRWTSHMTAGVHDVAVFLTPTDQQTAGTISSTDCGIMTSISSAWAYAAQTADAETVMPSDDGTGNPIGQVIKAGQSGFLQMHYINTTGAVIHPQVQISAYAYPDTVQPTHAAPFVTLNLEIKIGPGSATMPTTATVSGNCPMPLDAKGEPLKFFAVTTNTHKQGISTAVLDGAKTVFQSSNWQDPGSASWPTTPFYTFASGTLSYQCNYSNSNDYTIMTGDNAATDEMCMAMGYFFPAPDDPQTGGSYKGHLCLNSAMAF